MAYFYTIYSWDQYFTALRAYSPFTLPDGLTLHYCFLDQFSAALRLLVLFTLPDRLTLHY
jgi:hypothetical protein